MCAIILFVAIAVSVSSQFGILGFCICVALFALVIAFAGMASDTEDEAEEQLDQLRSDLKSIKAELDEIKQTLPSQLPPDHANKE